MKLEEITELNCILWNVSGKDLQLRIDKAAKDTYPLSVHKVIFDGLAIGQPHFELKDGMFIKMTFIVFPRMVGFFNFDSFRLIVPSVRGSVAMEFETFQVSISE